MTPTEPGSDIELGKGRGAVLHETQLTTSNYDSLKAPGGSSLTAIFDTFQFLRTENTNVYSTVGPGRVEQSTPELSPLLSSRNSSSIELPRFGRWYSRRDKSPTRLKLRGQARSFHVKLLLFIIVLGCAVLLTFIFVRKALGRSCWTWKGRLGGGSCSQWMKPGEEEEFWWDRHKMEEPEKKVEGPVAVPDFALDFAPFVYLHSDEVYLPINTSQHVEHTIPYLNYVKVSYPPPSLTLEDLSDISEELGRRRVFLTSPDNALSEAPQWITGKGVTEPKDGRSEAKATIIVVDKGPRDLDEDWGVVDDYNKEKQEARHNGVLTDVFYFYFYGFNLGPKVGGLRFGNHVGDWENTMIRFVDGVPKAVFFSQHATGIAVDYAAVEKIGKRPVTYSAYGTHANYPKAGTHSFMLPFHLLSDYANRGMLWDPVLNTDIYALNFTSSLLPPSNPWYTAPLTSAAQPDSYKLQPALQNPTAPIGWFHFDGYWGDKQLPISDPRQYGVGGLWSWANGPRGPRWKDLGRRNMCLDKYETYGRMPAEGACKIRMDLKEWEGKGKL